MKLMIIGLHKNFLLCLIGEKGHTLLSTSTTVLFCNHVLKPGDTKSGKCQIAM